VTTLHISSDRFHNAAILLSFIQIFIIIYRHAIKTSAQYLYYRQPVIPSVLKGCHTVRKTNIDKPVARLQLQDFLDRDWHTAGNTTREIHNAHRGLAEIVIHQASANIVFVEPRVTQRACPKNNLISVLRTVPHPYVLLHGVQPDFGIPHSYVASVHWQVQYIACP
jgi:hypothetical protein